MASSSDNLTAAAAFEPFGIFRHSSSFPDSWISEAYALDTETLTRALQSTFSNFDPSSFISDNSLLTNSDLLNLISSDSTATTPPTPTASNISAGSDFDTAPPPPVSNKRRRTYTPTNPGGGGGDAAVKASKRKSRASKRSQTTFITADPANFRQMVQQVTGVRFCNSQLPFVPVLKPEPQRLTNRFHGGGAGGCLPTLDTSAFLLDHHHQQQQQMVMGSVSGSGSGSFAQTVLGDGGSGGGLDLDCISSFPTLESFHGKLCDI